MITELNNLDDNYFVKTKRDGETDDSNVLMLSSKKMKIDKKPLTGDQPVKRLTKKERKRLEKMQQKAKKTQVMRLNQVKPMTKKQRKKVEKVLATKAKKSQRAELLQQLSLVMATPEEKALLISTSAMQTHKLQGEKSVLDVMTDGVKVNAIAGSNRRFKTRTVSESSDTSNRSTSTSAVSTDDEMIIEITASTSLAAAVTSSQATTAAADTKAICSDADAGKSQKSTAAVLPAADAGKIKESIAPREPAVNIPVNRTSTMQEQRLQLPILMEEQTIMEAIHDNPVVVIHGETGSGKTTQVPQFLYEAGYAHGTGIIGVTEPRRVAAVCMAKRVAEEMNLTSREVSYQIRYEGNTTGDTKIKFMTDGVLLKELQNDELLEKYRVIILDEAHERSVYTDVLIGWLSRIQRLRNQRNIPLSLIIMSAMLRIEDFTENRYLFPISPPVVKIETRKYQVVCHFNKRTDPDYLTAAYNKVCKIHRQEPDGGILVFVTGQQEVHTLCAKLRRTFPASHSSQECVDKPISQKRNRRPKKSKKIKTTTTTVKQKLPVVNLDDYSTLPLDEESELNEIERDSDDSELMDVGSDDNISDNEQIVGNTEQCLHLIPFYSLLSADRQARVFDPAPAGTRLCIVATNVAETSLTIPGIKYVVDTGKVKTKFYDKVTGVSTFQVTWISKASAEQRAGRAGRTGKGDCYRLYSSAVYENQFEKYSSPEITRRPVEDLVLQMKDLGICRVVNFPFPTRPDEKAIEAAEKSLTLLGALKIQRDTKGRPQAVITELGRTMAHFPIAPRYARMLTLGHQHSLLPYVVTMVAALSVQEVFVEVATGGDNPEQTEEAKKQRHRLYEIKRNWAGTGNCLFLGDVMLLLQAVSLCESVDCSVEFCVSNGLRHKAMIEIRKLRRQLTNTINTLIPSANLLIDPQLPAPTDLQAKLLRQIVLSGLGDHVARKFPVPSGLSPEETKKLRYAYQGMNLVDPIYIHPSSVLYHLDKEYIVYQSVEETSSRLYMKGVTCIDPTWLPIFVRGECRNLSPATDSKQSSLPPRYDASLGVVIHTVNCSFGAQFWSLPCVELEYDKCIDQLKWFAQFLLEGAVFPRLKPFAKFLLSPPSLMTKQWAHLQPRTTSLLNALCSENAFNRQILTDVWTKSPSFVLNEYIEWLPDSQHKAVKAIWPPV